MSANERRVIGREQLQKYVWVHTGWPVSLLPSEFFRSSSHVVLLQIYGHPRCVPNGRMQFLDFPITFSQKSLCNFLLPLNNSETVHHNHINSKYTAYFLLFAFLSQGITASRFMVNIFIVVHSLSAKSIKLPWQLSQRVCVPLKCSQFSLPKDSPESSVQHHVFFFVAFGHFVAVFGPQAFHGAIHGSDLSLTFPCGGLRANVRVEMKLLAASIYWLSLTNFSFPLQRRKFDIV